MWRDYADAVEHRLAKGGQFEQIPGFADKLPEQAARIAGVLTMIDNPVRNQLIPKHSGAPSLLLNTSQVKRRDFLMLEWQALQSVSQKRC